MQKLKQMLGGHHDEEKPHDHPNETSHSSSGYTSESRTAAGTGGGLTSRDTGSYGAAPGTGISSYEGEAIEPRDTTTTTGTSWASSGGRGSTGLESDVNRPFAKDESVAAMGSTMGTTGGSSEYPPTRSDDTYGSTSGAYGVTGAGLTGTALADRSVGSTGTGTTFVPSTFVEPTAKDLGVDASGGPHPTFTGNRLDPGFTESIPNYHEELAHDKNHASGTTHSALGPTGMAATTVYEDPAYATNTAGYEIARKFGAGDAEVVQQTETSTRDVDYTTGTAPIAPTGYHAARDHDYTEVSETRTSGYEAAAPVAPAGYHAARDHDYSQVPETRTTDYETPRTTDTSGYGSSSTGLGHEHLQHVQGAVGGPGGAPIPHNTDTTAIPTQWGPMGQQDDIKATDYTSSDRYKQEYASGMKTEHSSSQLGRNVAAGGAAGIGGAEIGKLLYEHKETGLSESDKAAAVRRYEAERKDEQSGSHQVSQSEREQGQGTSSDQDSSRHHHSLGRHHKEGEDREKESKGGLMGLLHREHHEKRDVSQRDDSHDRENTRSSGRDTESPGYGAVGTGLGAAGVGAAGAGAYEYSQSGAGSSSIPHGYDDARNYQSESTSGYGVGQAVTTGTTGTYDPYANESTTGPTGFVKGFTGDSNTTGTSTSGYGATGASTSGYGTSDNYGSSGVTERYQSSSGPPPTSSGYGASDFGASGAATEKYQAPSGPPPTSSSAIGSTGGYAERETMTAPQSSGLYEDQRVESSGNFSGGASNAGSEKRHGISALLHREHPNKLRKDPPGGRYQGQE